MAPTVVAAAIGNLTIAGVKNRALGDTPQTVEERECPVLARSTHDPDFVTEYVEQQITLQNNTRRDYTLNYKYYHSPAAKGRKLSENEVDNTATLWAVVGEMTRNRKLGGAKYISVTSVPTFRTIFDAQGREFNGAVISLRVTEF